VSNGKQKGKTVSDAVERIVKESVFRNNVRLDVIDEMDVEGVVDADDLDPTVLARIVANAAEDAGLSEEDGEAIAYAMGLH
jgi:hypothetical protein